MKISFLTSVMNRTHHLKETYLKNIHKCISFKNNCELEFVLLNYNSKDNLDEFVESNNFSQYQEIDFKYIKNESAKYFDMSRTKNILGKNSSGNVLCWLDADNYINENFVKFIYDHFVKNKNTIMNVEYNEKTKGMCGRVVISKTNFLQIGGYDEQMKGWGYEELDFVNRAIKNGLHKINIPLHYLGKLEHTQEERMKNYDPVYKIELNKNHSHSQMILKTNYDNFKLSCKNIKQNKLKANSNTTWGLL